MIQFRGKIAVLLLAIYSVVFAHNVIPHHHHLDIVDNLVAVFSSDDSEHHHHHHSGGEHHHHHGSHSHGKDVNVKHSHEHEPHEACHFEVQPVNSKTQIFITVLVLNNTFFKIKEPVKDILKNEFDYYPQRLLEGYNYAVPLRAPPVFA
jgi:ABC-type Zn2+ transport system substrate-binding protein/surface adhesin